MELEQFVLLLSQALTNEQGGIDSSNNSDEALMVQNFANQFNINMSVEQINKSKIKKNNGADLNLSEMIQQSLCRMDLLLKENFDLKRELVFNKKKFVDL